MFYEIENLNKTEKYGMGQKNCMDSQNELIIFVKSQNLINTFETVSINIIKNSISNKI